MPSSKQEREYARRRYEEWQRRQSARATQRRQRRRTAVLVSSVAVGVAVLVLVVAIGFHGLGGPGRRASGSSGASAAASTTPSASATPSASTASAASDPCPAPTSTPPAHPLQLASAPAASVAQARTWTGTITTSCGTLSITLDGARAPKAVASFVTLAQRGFFDASRCHRLVTTGIHVLQCGGATGTGTGGPGYSFGPVENAPASGVYPTGTLAMARVPEEGDSMGSQFFIVYADSTIPADSAGGYTVFGTVTSGLDVVQRVAAAGDDDSNGSGDGKPKTPISIEQVSVQ